MTKCSSAMDNEFERNMVRFWLVGKRKAWTKRQSHYHFAGFFYFIFVSGIITNSISIVNGS